MSGIARSRAKRFFVFTPVENCIGDTNTRALANVSSSSTFFKVAGRRGMGMGEESELLDIGVLEKRNKK